MSEDPVLRRRAQFAKAGQIGQRLGYLLFGAAMVLFIVGFAVGFTPGVVAAIVACLVVGSVFLAPAIVIAYAVRAAEQEEDGLSSH
jgi:hypothetical protein